MSEQSEPTNPHASESGSGLHVAFLRAINVGGKNRLPMEELRDLVEDLGAEDVRTYVQSGNVVYRADPELAQRIPELLREAIAEILELEVPVICRSAEELRAIAQANPYLDEGTPESELHVAFLADEPSPEQIQSLDPERSPPDRYQVRGREIYLHCPNGTGRSKLTTRYLDSQLNTTCTMRNWKTTLQLLSMVES